MGFTILAIAAYLLTLEEQTIEERVVRQPIIALSESRGNESRTSHSRGAKSDPFSEGGDSSEREVSIEVSNVSLPTRWTSHMKDTSEIFVFSHLPKAAGTSAQADFMRILGESQKVQSRRMIVCQKGERWGPLFQKRVSGNSDCNIVGGEVNIPTIRSVKPDAKIGMMMRSPFLHSISALNHLNRHVAPVKSTLDVEDLVQRLQLKSIPQYQYWLAGKSFQNITVAERVSLRYRAKNGRQFEPGIQWISPSKYPVEQSFMVVKSLWWVGIVESYEASMCLLMYQVGTIKRNTCSCAVRGNLRFSRKNTNRNSLSFSTSQLKKIWNLRSGDEVLYASAELLFRSRVQKAEKILCYKILCD
jgi:hypothetical protein